MFRLIRWLLGVALLGAFVYVAVKVPLGDKTLWQHLRAIAQTPESQDLVRGVKNTADRVLHPDAKPTSEGRTDARTPAPKPAVPPPPASDPTTEKDRAQLKHLIRDRLKRGK